MNGTIELLDDYVTSIKTLVASASVVNNCCVDIHEDKNILVRLKTLYDSSMVKKMMHFYNLLLLFLFLLILLTFI